MSFIVPSVFVPGDYLALPISEGWERVWMWCGGGGSDGGRCNYFMYILFSFCGVHGGLLVLNVW